MAFSRIDHTNFKPLNLAKAVNDALEMLKASTPNNINTCIHDLDSCPAIHANETQIHQIILNLCSNAYHAMENQGGTLTIQLSVTEHVIAETKDEKATSSHCLKLEISDNGEGINDSDLLRIFDPFFTTKKSGKGTGLGLSVVHGIVQQHKADIKVESQLGRGTSFALFFPITNDPIKKLVPIEILSKQSHGNILVVDDEVGLSEVYQDFLEHQGYTVTTCTNGHDAVILFKQQPQAFDLVLTDYSMPNMTGQQLASALFAIRPDIPVILGTGNNDLFSEQEAKKLGIREYLIKPIQLHTLQTIIEKTLLPTNS
jgi:CheY-like chemotaxis protein/two-component sensor histidine kinase